MVPPTIGGDPDGLPPGFPGAATMFPDVLGYALGVRMVLPASPVCCASEFCVSIGGAQAASAITAYAAAGHAL